LLPQMTRLVKLLYLVEVEYYRQKRRRLTDLDWKFYLYGPYPPALQDVLGEPEIEFSEWKGGKVSKQIVRDEESFMGAKADVDVESMLGRVVEEWGNADLNQLLDYVYFETEPMLNAKRGDTLDFSTIAIPSTKKLALNLDSAKLTALRKKVSERASAYSALRKPVPQNEELERNIQIWDKEDARRFPSGPCKLNLSDLAPDE
jgi:uncharacterized phage-associated protein